MSEDKYIFTIDRAIELEDENKTLRKQLDEAREKIDRISNPSIEILRDEFNIYEPKGGILSFFMNAFTQMFIDHGAKNYIEMKLHNALNADDPTEFIFHIQKKDGKTPHELLLEANTRLDIAVEAIKQAEIMTRSHEPDVNFCLANALAEINRIIEKSCAENPIP